MFYRKKVIMLDLYGKIYTMLEITQDGENVTVKAKNRFDIATNYKNKLTYFDDCDCFTLQNYTGGEIHFALFQKKEVVATGSTEGSHLPHLFTQDEKNTKDNSHSLQSSQQSDISQSDATHKFEESENVDIQNSSSINTCEQKMELSCKIEEKDEPTPPKMEEKSRNVHEFYCSIKPNLDEMLTCYPKEERLCNLIDESSWVKVERSDGHYAVGLIKNNGAPEYICYGVPGKENDTPPEHLKEYCTWIPTDDIGNGYWTVFQDAKTGVALCRNSK